MLRATRSSRLRCRRLFVGVAGAIYASWVNYIDPPDVFDVLLAVKPMVMVLLGGVGTIFGPGGRRDPLLAFEEMVWRNFLTFHAAVLGLIIVRADPVHAERHSRRCRRPQLSAARWPR